MNNNPNKSLTEIANNCPTDKGTTFRSCHGYTEFYEPFISKFKESSKPINILEIGIATGESLTMWKDYFNDNCRIFGLDIDDKTHLNEKNISCSILDQGNTGHLKQYQNYFIDNNVVFDIILDDGSHHMRDQILTFIHFIDSLSEDGIYFIEDLHTSLASDGQDLYGKTSKSTLTIKTPLSTGCFLIKETNI